MHPDTPIVLAAAKYSNRELAIEDFETVWNARKEGEFDHTAVAVLTKDSHGKLQMDRHDSTAKHLAWAGAALAVLVPPVGVGVLAAGAGGGAIVGHFWHNIPKEKVRDAADLLESGESGLIIVAVNKQGTDIRPLLERAEKTEVMDTVAGNLQADIDKELAEAKAGTSSS
jgi:hypothetical protein